jgi:hypothetical protein
VDVALAAAAEQPEDAPLVLRVPAGR